ncbi:thaumatin-like protein 1b [Rhododendron vialii]|uniref:thaumatin-like protein 1b n=1 Tax=Rhododendron vialii TaxID=182163 RepID=UPI0026603529|nr:thaumatin-like protein 1b [Rhododendron vialii]
MARLQLSLLALFSLCLTVLTSGVFSQSTFTIVNNCNYPVWPGLLSNPGVPQPPTTGFLLNPTCYTTLSMPASWAGNMWGRTLCSTDPNTGRFTCVTGDCGSGTVGCINGGNPPVTLAEFALDGGGGFDYYDISLVTGFNVPMNVVPQGGSGTCTAIECSADIDAACPTELQELWYGKVVGCKSACVAFGDPRDCCTGAYSTPATCGPTPYSEFFKSECPQAYSYAFDGAPVSCASADYTITFCP